MLLKLLRKLNRKINIIINYYRKEQYYEFKKNDYIC